MRFEGAGTVFSLGSFKENPFRSQRLQLAALTHRPRPVLR
jgi:hypothetical protein